MSVLSLVTSVLSVVTMSRALSSVSAHMATPWLQMVVTVEVRCNVSRLFSTLSDNSDVNECQTEANNCKYQCKNLIGTFLCTCPEGFRKVGMEDECVDVNECVEKPGVCANGRCINTEGGYQCECKPGFVSSPDGTECSDNRRGICYQRALRGRLDLLPYLSSWINCVLLQV